MFVTRSNPPKSRRGAQVDRVKVRADSFARWLDNQEIEKMVTKGDNIVTGLWSIREKKSSNQTPSLKYQ